MRDDGEIVKQYDYTPFGAVLNSTDINRTKFIGKEKDKESNYADHGVRKYDDEIGRFTSIDPLWEKYYSLTPYQYAGNNPVNIFDKTGFAKYYNNQGEVFADDGKPDENRYVICDDVKAENFLDENGNYNFYDLQLNSFQCPADKVISDFMQNVFDEAVDIRNEYSEGAGVEKTTVVDGKQVKEFVLGGINKNKPDNSLYQGDASKLVEKAVESARGWQNISYTMHTHRSR